MYRYSSIATAPLFGRYLVIDTFVYVPSECRLAVNAVVLVIGDSNVPWGGGGGIYPNIKLYCNVLGIDNIIADGETYTHTHTHRQPHYNSLATTSRLN